jgi:uncharacterized protein YndB with AHSA1/START domain
MTMKKLEFKTTINAKRDKVWQTMLAPDTYREWVNVSWPNSTYDGKWATGENIRFIGGSEENQGGTLANIVEARKPEYILAKHIAVINADGTEDRTSETAKGWIGTTEEYTFTEKDGKTELKVVINTSPDWESMFTDGWPNALNKLKEICERKAVTA